MLEFALELRVLIRFRSRGNNENFRRFIRRHHFVVRQNSELTFVGDYRRIGLQPFCDNITCEFRLTPIVAVPAFAQATTLAVFAARC